MAMPACLDYCSFLVSLEIREGKPSNLVHLFQSCLAILGYSIFLYKFWNQLGKLFFKNPAGILIGILLILKTNLGTIPFLTIMRLQIHEREIPLHLFMS